MNVLYEYCRKGNGAGRRNEDVFGVCGNCVWVIDGATDVFGKKIIKSQDEVSWYVNKLSAELSELYSEQLSLKNNLIRATNEIYQKLGCPMQEDAEHEYYMPTYAIAMVNILGDKLNYYILGDCQIAYFDGKTISTISDNRIKKFSKENRTALRLNSEKPEKIQEAYQNTRSKANKGNGYYIGSVMGTGLEYGISGQITVSPKDRLIMYSDGFLDYIESNPNRLRSFLDPCDIHNEIKNMQRYLNDIEIFAQHPRPKKVDDQTILLLEV